MSKANHQSSSHDGISTLLKEPIKALCEQDWGVSPAEIGSLCGAAHALVIAAMAHQKGVPLVVVLPGAQALEEVALDLATLAGELELIEVPDEEVRDAEHMASLAHWLPVLSRLTQLRRDKPAVIMTTVTSLLVSLPNERRLAEATVSLELGETIDPGGLLERLSESGYQRTGDVEQRGEFSRRGGIVDLWPHALDHPLRLDFFGDEIESMRSFDPATQRSIAKLKAVAFPVLSESELLGKDDGTGLLNYLPHGTLPVMYERRDSLQRLENLRPFFGARRTRIDSLTQWMSETPRVDLFNLPVMERRGGMNLRCDPLPLHEGGMDGAADTIAQIRKQCQQIDIYAGSEGEAKRLGEALDAHKIARDGVHVHDHEISGSVVFPELQAAILSGAELLGKHKMRAGIRIAEPSAFDTHHRAIDDFIQLEKGDYVVHAGHGIGKYVGTEELRTPDGARGEYLRLRFDGGTEVHVPVANADQVQKYIGSRGTAPKLSRYNSRSWAERKGQVQQSVIQLAAEMLKLQAIRESEVGYTYPPSDELEHDFVESFPYRDTPDQEKAWEHIRTDMESTRPSDRLICGDVGFGKTELAMRAAYKVAAAGKQVAVLVPTTVLCQQHWLSFSSRMAGFPVVVESLSRFKSAKEQRKVIEGIKKGSVDIVIGTHRLLSKDVEFKDLGLVVIDEEQRFGVEAKERLKNLRATVDVLTLTATPIPRTLHMALLGIRDITSLTTPPQDRHPVHTQTVAFNDAFIREAVLRELARDGQVFFVHNRVNDIEELTHRLRKLVPEARIVFGHGQMADGELEQVMLKFINHEADVLVCTTIIESGIDVQSANTMFIDQAHKYGLADLHQLRGRVGRYRHHAYCYLIVPKDARMREDAQKRMQAILKYTTLGSGFHIAMQDLEIRGAGNILGAEQSGHIASVGYDLYCQLLQRAVSQLRGEDVINEVETTIELDLDLVLPRKYVKDAKQRVHVYRMIARCGTTEEADEVREALVDRFGKAPKVIDRLLQVAVVRHRLGRLGVTNLNVGSQSGNLFFRLKVLSAKATLHTLQKAQPNFRMLDDETIVLPLQRGLDHALDQLRYLSNLLQSMVTRGMLREHVPQKKEEDTEDAHVAKAH